MNITLTLPYPPSTNRLWTRTRKGMRKTDEYSAWIHTAGWEANAQGVGTMKGPYKLSIHAVRPDNRKRDLGNLEKGISDLLQRLGIIEDDCLAEEIYSRWVKAGKGVTIILEPAES